MSPHTPAPCPHDVGPGTTVCLRCRRDARAAARVRRYRLLARLGLAGLALSGFAAAGTAGANALQARRSADVADPAAKAPAPAKSAARDRGAKAEEPRAEPDAQPASPPMWPVFAAGRAALGDDLFAMRDENMVTVHFDTPAKRTRRPEKFEAVVRASLAQVYGPAADSLLATIPQGSLTRGGDLLTELPTRGLRWPLGSGWTLELWPVTRPGQDGPLVVAYRTAVTR